MKAIIISWFGRGKSKGDLRKFKTCGSEWQSERQCVNHSIYMWTSHENQKIIFLEMGNY